MAKSMKIEMTKWLMTEQDNWYWNASEAEREMFENIMKNCKAFNRKFNGSDPVNMKTLTDWISKNSKYLAS